MESRSGLESGKIGLPVPSPEHRSRLGEFASSQAQDNSTLPEPADDWTLLVYTSSSADIVDYSRQSLEELATQAPGSLKVAVQWGQPDNSIRRLTVSQGELTEADATAAGDQATGTSLEQFLEWGIKKYPSKHLAVVIGGHGAGFMGCVTDGPRRKMMRMPEVGQALENSGVKPDLVVFNSCLMSGFEVARELQGRTPVLVGAQGPEHGPGLPLAAWSQALVGADSGQEAGQQLVELARQQPQWTELITALDVSKLQAVDQALESVCQVIQAHPDSLSTLREGLAQMTGHWEKPAEYPLFRQIDIGQLASIWSSMESLPPDLRQATTHLGRVCQETVLATTNQKPEAGFSIFAPAPDQKDWQKLPLFDGKLGQLYAQLRSSQEGHWDETLECLTKGNS